MSAEFAVDLFAGTFTCNVCECSYGAEEMFHRAKNGRTGTCRPCRGEYRRAYYAKDPASAIAYSLKWKHANRGRWLDANRKSKYGIPYGTYAAMLAEQGGCCAICRAPEPSGVSLHVDHDHETGKIRSLLCDLCNRGLGYFADNADRLNAAADYLRKWTNA